MDCFARVTKSAVAVEVATTACTTLRKRATALRAQGLGTFDVICEPYQKGVPDAEIYTWWEQVRHAPTRCMRGANVDVLVQDCVESMPIHLTHAARWSAGRARADRISTSLRVSTALHVSQGPHLINEAALKYLRGMLKSGRVRQTAQAVLLFDMGWKRDIASWRAYNASGLAAWSQEIHFDETTLCRKHHGNKPGCQKRARGAFIVAGFPLNRTAP